MRGVATYTRDARERRRDEPALRDGGRLCGGPASFLNAVALETALPPLEALSTQEAERDLGRQVRHRNGPRRSIYLLYLGDERFQEMH